MPKESRFTKHLPQIEQMLKEGKSIRQIAREVTGEKKGPDWESCRSYTQYVKNNMEISNPHNAPARPEIPDHKTNWKEGEEGAEWEYTGTEIIDNLEKALERSKVDLEEFRVDRQEFRTWTTTAKNHQGHVLQKQNYYCKITFKRKNQDGIDWKVIREAVHEELPSPIKTPKSKGSKLVLGLADIHIGAEVQKLLKTPDFNYDSIRELFSKAAAEVNATGCSVDLCMVGDFIETFTGINHPRTWHEIHRDGFGSNVIMIAHDLIAEFFESIDNLNGFYMVAGNHDRTGVKKDDDPRGQAAHLIHWALSRTFPKLDTDYHPILLSQKIDGINYILEHGHLGVDKRNIGHLVFKHGEQDCYNVILSGHWHERKGKKVYQTVETTQVDELQYRKITLPPVFSGNFYSTSNDWDSHVGFATFRNNGSGRPIHTDYSL